MNKSFLIVLSVLLSIFFLQSCKPGTSSNNLIDTNPATIAAGGELFKLNCSGCHNFTQDGIGPQLSGLTVKLPAEWIEKFIKDPQQMIANDERAKEIYKKYKTIMPAFGTLKDEEINKIVAFIHTHKQTVQGKAHDGNALSNPIPQPITVSGLTLGLQLVSDMPSSSVDGKAPLARITKMDVQPGTNDLFVLDLRGKLYRLQNNKPTVYMDMAKLKPKFVNEPGLATGFGSFAFHPEFFRNGILYTTHAETPGSGKADFAFADSIKVTLQWVLTEWKADDPMSATFSGTGRELMRINMVTGIHGVQEISFDPLARKGKGDYGLLYVGVGDGGAVENGYQSLAHSKEKIWGTILRIDPAGKNSLNGQYGIPDNNPFAHDENKRALGEIYAYGFRNPHRFCWSSSGKMIACNIGQANIESIDVISAGHDYGWPLREGSFLLDPYGNLSEVYPLPPNDTTYKITYPVAEYDHDEGKAISGGFEYTGHTIAILKGKYLFGDIPTGRLLYVDLADMKPGQQATVREWRILIDGEIKTLKELCGNDRVDLHFGRDSKGELYILTKADGKIYKLVKVAVKASN